MNDQTVAIIIAVLGSRAFLKIVDAIVASIKEKRKKPTPLEEGLRWLLQDKLEYLATQEIQRCETTGKMKSFLRRGYEIYHELGGNGDMKTLMEEYEDLPVKY